MLIKLEPLHVLFFVDQHPNIAEILLFNIRASASSGSNLPIVKTNFVSNSAARSNQLTPLRKVIQIAVAVTFLTALAIRPTHAATVTTNGFDLFVNGSPMVIKGMNYSPVPIGAVPGNPPYGDYFVPEYSNVGVLT